MNKENQFLLRLSVRLQQQYANQRRQALLASIADTVERLREHVDLAANHERLLRRAVNSGWSCCLAEKWLDYTRAVEEIESQARAIHAKSSTLGFSTPQIPGSRVVAHEYGTPPGLRDLYDELRLALREFGEVEYGATEHRISVTTDRIELEGIDLGPFRIDLFLEEMRSDMPENWFCVTAVEPNGPAARDEITHPHISDGKLCTGDGAAPIQQALLSGRIGEFFMLVRSVLETYNADSAYVMLEHWSGSSCEDCGYIDDLERLYFCEGCERDYCDECMLSCHICSTTLCRGCLEKSELSGNYVCGDCGGKCSSCDRFGTADEITDGLCEFCGQEQQDDDAELATSTESHPTTPVPSTLTNQEHFHDAVTTQPAAINNC